MNDDPSDLPEPKVEYQHFRLPLVSIEDGLPYRGKPPEKFLYRFYRKHPKGKTGFEYRWAGPLSRGGKTVCIITTDDGKQYSGVAYCSVLDTFNYRIGRNIAYGRALKALKEDNAVMIMKGEMIE